MKSTWCPNFARPFFVTFASPSRPLRLKAFRPEIRTLPKSKILALSIAVGVLAALTVSSVFAQSKQVSQPANYFLFNLGTPLGGTSSADSSINREGWISGGANLAGNATEHAVLWIGSELDLGTLGGPNSTVAWPNHDNRGAIVGIAETAALDPLGENWSCSAFFPSVTGHICRGFVWQNGAMTALPTLGGNNGYAAGANNRGQAVGWAENTVHDPTCVPPQVLQFEAAVWDTKSGHLQQLPPYSGDVDGAATAVNDNGDVVGISGTCDNAVGEFTAAHALLWHNGTPTNLGSLGGVAWNTPAAINDEGEVVGFSDLPGDESGAPNFHAFLWTKSTGMQDLGTLPGDVMSIAYGINQAGQIVGQSIAADGTSRAFLWQNGVMTDLNTLIPSGSTLSLLYANDINDHGEIVGQAYDSTTTDTPGFLAVPEYANSEKAASTARENANLPKVVLPAAVRKQLLKHVGIADAGQK